MHLRETKYSTTEDTFCIGDNHELDHLDKELNKHYMIIKRNVVDIFIGLIVIKNSKHVLITQQHYIQDSGSCDKV